MTMDVHDAGWLVNPNTTYVNFQSPQDFIEISCGDEKVVVTWQEVFDTLKKVLRLVGEDAHE